MEELPVSPVTPPEPKRPQLLMILCILTFIGSGWSFLSSLVAGIFNETFREIGLMLAERFSMPEIAIILEAPVIYFLLTGVLYAVAVTGAVLMWRLRKNGFHVYTIAQILLLIAPMYFLHLPGPPMLEVFASGIFIILYSSQLKHMIRS